MPNSVEAQGLTVEEAIQTALNQLGTSRERVEIKIMHHPRGGFLGIGARRAKVRATMREDAFQDGEEFDMSPHPRPQRRRRRGGRGRSDSKPDAGRSREAGDGNRDRNDRNDRTDKTDRPDRSEADRRGRDANNDERAKTERGGKEERSRDDRRGRGGRNNGGRGGQDRGGQERGERKPREPRQQPNEERNTPNGNVAEQAAPPVADVDGNTTTPGETRLEGEPRRGRTRRRRGGRGRGRRAAAEARAESEGETPAEGAVPQDFTSRDQASDTAASAATAAASGTAASVPPQTAPESRRNETAGPAQKVDIEKIREQAWELVGELVNKMGFEATVEVARDDDDQVIVKVSSPAEGLLIGRRGQTLDAMEHVLNRMIYAGEAAGDSAVVLDIGGYRERRRQSLYDMATRLRDRSLVEQRSVQISPMAPRDRRVIQDVLAEDHTVKLKIVGTGLYRRIQITPAGIAETHVSKDDEVAPDENG